MAAMFSHTDTLHLSELLNEHIEPTTSNKGKLSHIIHTPLLLHTNPDLNYHCCGMQLQGASASNHFFTTHFNALVTKDPPGETPRFVGFKRVCRKHADIGDKRIALIPRAQFFMETLKNVPSNPGLFRPYPRLPPPSIKNPYSAAMALAYDFMSTLSCLDDEYLEFLKAFADPNHDFSLNAHLTYFPFWACFRYPCLKPIPHPAKKPCPYSSMLVFQASSPLPQRTFRCHACDRHFKQKAGLQYHISRAHPNDPANQHSRCRLSMNLQCPFTPCTNIYTSLTGIRHHLKMNHLNQPHPDTANSRHACPIPPCQTACPSLNQLKRHLLSAHFWSFNHPSASPA
ncbi:hypothetical protein DSO57_1017152 [Entomophthora muscae]|uniref:Uncharacterized protein n=1 Tax=Entomophthora muscae TaxID=34485 RepID=A0ACC2S6S4_9FUNG|nr:hypothetical protein DSO57_1017152 [Entomophthora muscae]